jgi:hypothetical protein
MQKSDMGRYGSPFPPERGKIPDSDEKKGLQKPDFSRTEWCAVGRMWVCGRWYHYMIVGIPNSVFGFMYSGSSFLSKKGYNKLWKKPIVFQMASSNHPAMALWSWQLCPLCGRDQSMIERSVDWNYWKNLHNAKLHSCSFTFNSVLISSRQFSD